MSRAAKRRRKTRAAVSAVASDFGPPERAQHGDVVIDFVATGKGDTTTRDRARVKPDDWLYRYRRNRNRTITAEMFQAGRVLQALWDRSGLKQRTIPKYGAFTGRGSVASAMVATLDRGSRFRKAMLSVPRGSRDTVFTVCCLDHSIAPARVADLRTGLRHLAMYLKGATTSS